MTEIIDVVDALGQVGSGGLVASLMGHHVALSALLDVGNYDLIQRVVPSVISGNCIIAMAISEPGAGLDRHAALCAEARAARDVVAGSHFVVNGEKTYVTNGCDADYIVVAARTEANHGGVSLLLVEGGGSDGLVSKPLEKMGWHCSETAHLTFNKVCVPASNLIGEQSKGFQGITGSFDKMRIVQAASAEALARACYEEALDWSKAHWASGRRLGDHQVVRHMLVDMVTRCNATRSFLNAVAQAHDDDLNPVAEICQLKNVAAVSLERTASDAVQILGAFGCLLGSKSERIYRESKIVQVTGGRTGTMKDMVSRKLEY